MFLILFINLIASSELGTIESIKPEEARAWNGRHITVCGIASSINHANKSKSKPTFINLGPKYPKQAFTIVIWENERINFDYPLESLKEKRVCVTGRVEIFRGTPQIEPRTQSNLSIH